MFNLYCEQFAGYLKKATLCNLDNLWFSQRDVTDLGGIFDGKYSEETMNLSLNTDSSKKMSYAYPNVNSILESSIYYPW